MNSSKVFFEFTLTFQEQPPTVCLGAGGLAWADYVSFGGEVLGIWILSESRGIF